MKRTRRRTQQERRPRRVPEGFVGTARFLLSREYTLIIKVLLRILLCNILRGARELKWVPAAGSDTPVEYNEANLRPRAVRHCADFRFLGAIRTGISLLLSSFRMKMWQ